MIKISGIENIKSEAVRENLEKEWLGARPPSWFKTVQVGVHGDIITVKFAPGKIALYRVLDGVLGNGLFLDQSEVDFISNQMYS